MWEVKIEDDAAKIFEEGKLTDEDKIVIRKWTEIVIEHGPEGLLNKPNLWADHELYGEWRGHRSSSFSYEGRIIYRVEKKMITVVVVKITTNHDYRK